MALYQAQLSRDGGALTEISVLLSWMAGWQIIVGKTRWYRPHPGTTFDCTGYYVIQQGNHQGDYRIWRSPTKTTK